MSKASELIFRADSLRVQGRYEKASDLYIQAARILIGSTTDTYLELVHTKQQLGVCMARLGRHDFAIECYNLAIEVVEEVEPPIDIKETLIAKVLRDRADSKAKLCQIDEALEDLEISNSLFGSYGLHNNDLTINEHFMGRLHRKQGNNTLEGDCLISAYENVVRDKDHPDKLYIYLDYASWLVRVGEAWNARKISASALKMAIQKKSVPHVIRALQLMIFAKHPKHIHRALYGRN